MQIYGMLLSAGLSFVFLALVFRPLELAFPAKPTQKFFRPAWLTDLWFFLGQYLIWNVLVLIALTYFVSSRGEWTQLELFHVHLGKWPDSICRLLLAT